MPQTLLLADDSVTIQRVIELTFADEDINVVAVSDGEQAIARLDTMPPDIVLVDVGMPGKSGYDVAGHVKHTPHLSHIPVVLLTGAFEPVDEVKANAIGCDGILAKPFEPQAVISRVKELLARPTSAAPEPATGSELDAFAPEMNNAVPALPPAPVANEATAKLDEYFDQLDSAFARFTSTPSARPADLVPAVAEDATPAELDWFGPPRGSESSAMDPSLSLQEPPPLAALPTLPSGLQLPDSAELVREVNAFEPPPFVDRFADLPSADAAPEPVVASEPVVAPEPVAVPEPVAALKPMASPEPIPALAPVPTPPPAAYTVVMAAATQPSEPRALPAIGEAFNTILTAEQADPAWPAPAPAAGLVITDELVDRVAQRVIAQLTDRVVRDAVAEAVSGIAEKLVREEIERIKKSIE